MGIPRNDTDQEFARWVDECAAKIDTTEADTAPPAEPGRVDRALLLRLGEVGLLPALFPGTADDGPLREAPATRLCLLREHLARTDTHAETALALQGLGTYPLLQSGTERQRRRWSPKRPRGGPSPPSPSPNPTPVPTPRPWNCAPNPSVTAGACTVRRPGSPTRPTPTSTPCSPAPPPGPAPGA